jgi:uncharacterized membrane protein
MSHGVVLGPQLSPSAAAEPATGERLFELTPRCSLTPRTARIFIATVAAGTFPVAAVFSLQGFWPILPFAGLEIALLIWAVHASMRKGQERETVLITAGSITVQCHSVHGDRTSVFPRHWARVRLHAPLAALHPSRLFIESRGCACELGGFLTEGERRSLAARLQQLVGNVNESPALSE